MACGIVVINLDRDTERMAYMRRQLEYVSISYERFSALRGDQLPPDLARYFPADANLSPGEVGCYASHLAVLQRIARGELASPQLVLEDDVGLPDDLPQALGALMAALPERWDIVRLSYRTKRVTRSIASLGGGRHLVRYSRVPTTTGAYLISASGAQKFLAHRLRRRPIDHDLRCVWEWGLDTYGVSPPLVAHDAFGESTIDALSPKGRARSHARVNERLLPWSRMRQGVRDFGLSRWLAIGPLNLVVRATPKRLRSSIARWANARLA